MHESPNISPNWERKFMQTQRLSDALGEPYGFAVVNARKSRAHLSAKLSEARNKHRPTASIQRRLKANTKTELELSALRKRVLGGRV